MSTMTEALVNIHQFFKLRNNLERMTSESLLFKCFVRFYTCYQRSVILILKCTFNHVAYDFPRRPPEYENALSVHKKIRPGSLAWTTLIWLAYSAWIATTISTALPSVAWIRPPRV